MVKLFVKMAKLTVVKEWRKFPVAKILAVCNRGIYTGRRNYSSEAGNVEFDNADSSPKDVGFIGLGNMGSHMAKNLLSKGHNLTVYDIQSASTIPFEKLGARVVPTPAEVVKHAQTVITMLPAGPHVRTCYTGSDGLLAGVKPGSIFIDSSTIDADTSKDMANAAKLKQCTYFDSPVSGGVAAASTGTLTFMVGGPEKQFSDIKPLLLKMGSKVVYCGGTGAGQAAKICNNMLLGICMIGTAETMNLGIKMGLDPKLLASIINSSSGRCWSSEMYNPVPGVVEKVPASRNYEGGFGSALMCKDLGLAQTAAAGSGTPTPMGSLAFQIYQMVCSKGFRAKDFSYVFQFIQEQKDDASTRD